MTVAQLRLILEDLCQRGFQSASVQFEGWDDSGDLVSFLPKGDVRKTTDAVGQPRIVLR